MKYILILEYNDKYFAYNLTISFKKNIKTYNKDMYKYSLGANLKNNLNIF